MSILRDFRSEHGPTWFAVTVVFFTMVTMAVSIGVVLLGVGFFQVYQGEIRAVYNAVCMLILVAALAHFAVFVVRRRWKSGLDGSFGGS